MAFPLTGIGPGTNACKLCDVSSFLSEPLNKHFLPLPPPQLPSVPQKPVISGTPKSPPSSGYGHVTPLGWSEKSAAPQSSPVLSSHPERL